MPSSSIFGAGTRGPTIGQASGETTHHPAPVFSPPPALHWKLILDQLPYGLIVLGPGQELRHENATCRHLLGFGVAEKGGVEGWLASFCPDQNHRERVINSWREHIWRNQLTRTFTLKTAGQKLKEIEFRSSLLRDGGITLTIEDVTETRRTEETLRHGKLKFGVLFSHSETGTVLVDRTGRIIEANPAFVRLIGISLKNLRLTSLSGLLHPNEAEELARAEEALTSTSIEKPGGKAVSREVWLRSSQSEKRARITYCPISEAAGRPEMAIYLFTPLDSASANEKLTARLRAVSAKAQALLHAVPDLILLIDPGGLVVDFAPPPKPWRELVPDDSWRRKPAEEVWPVFGNLLKQFQSQVSGQGKTINADIRGPEDNTFEFAVTLSPCGDGHILAVIRNHSGTRAMRDRDLWQSAAFSHCPLPIVMLDTHGVVSGANLAAATFLGLSEEALRGKNFADFSMHGDLRRTSDFFALEQGGKPRGSIVFLERPDKTPLYAEKESRLRSLYTPTEKIQHGFRNQLQLVTSLFSLEPQSAAARDAFIRWQIRLRSMAQACPFDHSANVWIFPLLRNLADDVCSLIGRGSGRKEVIITGSEDLTLDLQTATPFSLLIGELMRLVLATRQPGPGPELYINLRSRAEGGFQLTLRPGTNRSFVFTDRETEVEILELLTDQIQGRLEPTDQGNPTREWILIVPSVKH